MKSVSTGNASLVASPRRIGEGSPRHEGVLSERPEGRFDEVLASQAAVLDTEPVSGTPLVIGTPSIAATQTVLGQTPLAQQAPVGALGAVALGIASPGQRPGRDDVRSAPAEALFDAAAEASPESALVGKPFGAEWAGSIADPSASAMASSSLDGVIERMTQQVVHAVEVHRAGSGMEVSLSVDLGTLGRGEIELRQTEGGPLELVLRTQSEAGERAMAAQLPELRERLASRGIELGRLVLQSVEGRRLLDSSVGGRVASESSFAGRGSGLPGEGLEAEVETGRAAFDGGAWEADREGEGEQGRSRGRGLCPPADRSSEGGEE